MNKGYYVLLPKAIERLKKSNEININIPIVYQSEIDSSIKRLDFRYLAESNIIARTTVGITRNIEAIEQNAVPLNEILWSTLNYCSKYKYKVEYIDNKWELIHVRTYVHDVRDSSTIVTKLKNLKGYTYNGVKYMW